MGLFLRLSWGRKPFLLAALFLTVTLALQAQVNLVTPADGAMPAPYGKPAIADGTIYFSTESGIEGRRIVDAHLLWRHPLVRNVPAALVLADGRLIVAESAVYALDVRTGVELWHFQPVSDTSLCVGTAFGGLFFVGDTSHWLYALRVADGSLAWRQRTSAKQTARSRVAGLAVFGNELYATEESWVDAKGLESHSTLSKLSAATGRIVWQINDDTTTRPGLKQSSWLQPVIMPSGDVLVADTAQNTLTRFSSSGKSLWTFAGVPEYLGPLVPPEVRDDIVFFESGDRYFRQLRASDGAPIRATLFVGSLTDFILCGNSAIVSRGALERVDIATGARARQSLLSSAHLISARLLRGEDHKSAMALNSEGLWTIPCDMEDTSSPSGIAGPR